ncbi:malto-oligosyltrehalose trehalohydrolase [Rhizobium sp. 21-4511-3d]
MQKTGKRRMAWGPQAIDGGMRFRLWAPGEAEVSLRLNGRDMPMVRFEDGWFEAAIADVRAGDAYAFVTGDGRAVPDPAARRQKGGVHGLSLVASSDYRWRSDSWTGRDWEEAVISEIHIGTFTQAGTFAGAAEQLADLAAAGITAIEIMPVAQFAGQRGWGYDGVLHYAPHPAYGTPDEFRAFIDAAHAEGIMVLLDVVYNHFGPEGNYLHGYAPEFFRTDRATPWGDAIDFSQPAVRRYFIDNALYWIGDFRLDGLRLDAVEQIHDMSARHVLDELAQEVRAAFPDRKVHLVIEDQRNLVSLLERDARGGIKAFTAEWNDDFHHVAHIIGTGEADGHYTAFAGDLWQKTRLALQHGFVYPDRANPPVLPDGERVYLPPEAFINFLQNHDQIGNRAFGERLVSLAPQETVEALTAIMMLSPQIPFLFMGEDYGESQPFYFFCDYTGELGEIVRKGRMAEAEGFGGLKGGRSKDELPDPNAQSTFDGSKLQWQRARSPEGRRRRDLVRELARLRQRHIVPLIKETGRVYAKALETTDGGLAIDWHMEGAVLQLRANLSGEPLTLPAASGRPIYGAPPDSGLYAQNTVVFAIA